MPEELDDKFSISKWWNESDFGDKSMVFLVAFFIIGIILSMFGIEIL